jgi:hypothetical protein
MFIKINDAVLKKTCGIMWCKWKRCVSI